MDFMSKAGFKKNQRYVPDLVRDIATCDANYIRLQQLFPAMDKDDHLEFGLPGSSEEVDRVRLSVIERCPYTTCLRIQVTADELQCRWLQWPSMEVRIYHDLATAEVICFDHHRSIRQRYEQPNPDMHLPDEKSQINCFLGELLSQCLSRGQALNPLPICAS
jgi:hypothetical protein